MDSASPMEAAAAARLDRMLSNPPPPVEVTASPQTVVPSRSRVPLAPVNQGEGDRQRLIMARAAQQEQAADRTALAQRQAVMAAEMAAMGAARNSRTDNAKAAQAAERKMAKLVDQAGKASGAVDAEHQENVRMLQSYKEKYEGKVFYQFKKKYGYDMSKEAALQELHNIRLVLNSQDTPTVMKMLVGKVAEITELLCNAMGYKYANAADLADTIKLSVKEGYFDPEIDQLAIEWAPWFGQKPLNRLLWKYAGLCGATFLKNAPELGTPSQKLNEPLPRKTAQKAADL